MFPLRSWRTCTSFTILFSGIARCAQWSEWQPNTVTKDAAAKGIRFMSYISNAIEELLVKNKLTAAGLSRASGMTEAQISRYRNGKKTWVSSEDLIRIARGFCPPPNADLMPEIHAFLLYACLRDVYVGPGADYISIALAADHAVP